MCTLSQHWFRPQRLLRLVGIAKILLLHAFHPTLYCLLSSADLLKAFEECLIALKFYLRREKNPSIAQLILGSIHKRAKFTERCNEIPLGCNPLGHDSLRARQSFHHAGVRSSS